MIRETRNMDLSGHNSFRMKVSCRNFLEYDCDADLEKLDFESFYSVY